MRPEVLDKLEFRNFDGVTHASRYLCKRRIVKVLPQNTHGAPDTQYHLALVLDNGDVIEMRTSGKFPDAVVAKVVRRHESRDLLDSLGELIGLPDAD